MAQRTVGGHNVAGGRLYIADTNNHVVRVADLESGPVGTLELRGVSQTKPCDSSSST